MHEEDVRPPDEKSHAYHFSITYNGYWSLLQLLLFPSIYLILGLHYVPGSHGSHASQKRS